MVMLGRTVSHILHEGGSHGRRQVTSAHFLVGRVWVGRGGQGSHGGDNGILLLELHKWVRLVFVEFLDARLACLSLNPALECGIVVVFDVVVSPAWQVLGDLRPLVAVEAVELKDFLILLGSPLYFLYVGVQVVMPSRIKFISTFSLKPRAHKHNK